jgi:hypothetical protein
VVSWLKSFLAHIRLGGHHWLIDKWSHIYWIAVYVLLGEWSGPEIHSLPRGLVLGTS